MYRMFKVCVLILVSVAHLSNLGMNRVNKLSIQPKLVTRVTSKTTKDQGVQKAFAIERAYHHFDRLAEDSNKTKLLEHPCFPGESFNFQSKFFSSNYMDLPKNIASNILLITKDVPVDPGKFVFTYHAHYRKPCSDLIESFARVIMTKKDLYNRECEELMSRHHTIYRMYYCLSEIMSKDLGLHIKAFDSMMKAFHDNHYPTVLELYREYRNMYLVLSQEYHNMLK